MRLRIKHDQPVRVGPAVVAGLPDEGITDAGYRLPAAMERHVHPAPSVAEFALGDLESATNQREEARTVTATMVRGNGG